MSFSQRLKEERRRLKLKQTTLAEKVGIHPKSQIDYEKDRLPAFKIYLDELAKIGIDVGYVITGVRHGVILNEEESEMLAAFRAASPEVRAAAMAALKAGIAMAIKQVNVGRDNIGNIHM